MGHLEPCRKEVHMARFTFYVGRHGAESVKCSAEVPSAEDMLTFDGGAVLVFTPEHGTLKVTIPSGMDLMAYALNIHLQNGVRDVVLPKDEGPKRGTKRHTGYDG